MQKIFDEIKKLEKNEIELFLDCFSEFLKYRKTSLELENKYSISAKKGKVGNYINYININNILYINLSLDRLYIIDNNIQVYYLSEEYINININKTTINTETENIYNILIYIYNILSKSNSKELPKSFLSESSESSASMNDIFVIEKHSEHIPEKLLSDKDFVNTYQKYLVELKKRFEEVQTLEGALEDFSVLLKNRNPVYAIKKCMLNKQKIGKYTVENNASKSNFNQRKRARII
jgi:hypothetical protein